MMRSIAHPLAYGFKLIDGTVNYTVPSNATARPNYFLVRAYHLLSVRAGTQSDLSLYSRWRQW